MRGAVSKILEQEKTSTSTQRLATGKTEVEKNEYAILSKAFGSMGWEFGRDAQCRQFSSYKLSSGTCRKEGETIGER